MGGDFTLLSKDGIYIAKARKKLKINKILVGDFVDFDTQQSVIEKLLPRYNQLIRPPVANVDQAFIVIAPVPKPDFMLVDKLLIKFFSLKINPIIIINKSDITSLQFIDDIEMQYKNVCKILVVSTFDANKAYRILMPMLKNKLSVLTGQSAVGKTSLLNVLSPNTNEEVGELSKKALRGKNTTRYTQIYVLENGGLLVDSPGFNAFLLDDFTPEQVIDNYPDFSPFKANCKFNNCNHINEAISICAVKDAVKENKISQARYDRFVEIYKKAKQKQEEKYG